tara:strand:+ start:2987 stop:3670 length:684 start_codon:yes stop_codon:yes gene_type:complete
MKLKTLFLGGLTGLIFVATPLSYAHADNWWDFLFPMAREDKTKPTDDGRAPFADPDAIMDGPSLEEKMAGNTSPLHIRHRLNSEIAKWVEAEISIAMTYDAENYKDQYAQKAKSFDKKGLEEYVKFLQDNKIVQTLKSGAYDVRGIVKDVPVLLNEKAIGGRYRWLYRAKVMMTFVPVAMTEYKNGSAERVINKEVIINMQIGRVANANNEHGVKIESWSGKIAEEE